MALTTSYGKNLHYALQILFFSIINIMLGICLPIFKSIQDMEHIQKNLAMQLCPKIWQYIVQFLHTFSHHIVQKKNNPNGRLK